MRLNETSEKTDPCNDPIADLGDILHCCSVTIPIDFKDRRGTLGISHMPFETKTRMTTRMFCCVFGEKEDGKYEAITRYIISYEGAQQLKAFVKKLPEQIFTL